MLAAVNLPARPLDRHFLLQSIVQEAYKLRTDRVMREVCRRIARRHLAEFPQLKRPLKRSVGGFMPRVSTFEHFAMVLTEDGDYEEAVRVAELAVSYGVFDDTFVESVKSRIAHYIKRGAKEPRVR